MQYINVLGSRNLIGDEGFSNALYMIDIGQNDLADSFAKNLSYAQVVKRIPSIIFEIKNSIEVSIVTGLSSLLFSFSPTDEKEKIKWNSRRRK